MILMTMRDRRRGFDGLAAYGVSTRFMLVSGTTPLRLNDFTEASWKLSKMNATQLEMSEQDETFATPLKQVVAEPMC